MAHLHASEGDVIEIQRVQYTVRSGEMFASEHTDRDIADVAFVLERKALMCKGCGQNEVDGDTDWEGYCPGCLNQAQRWIVVQEMLDTSIPQNVLAVIAEDRRQIQEAHNGGSQYYDLRSVAKDSIYPEDKEEIIELVDDVFDVVRGNILRAAGKEVM